VNRKVPPPTVTVVIPAEDASGLPEGATLVRTWPSSSGKGHYNVVQGADGGVYCTCPAWKFSKTDPKSCKHLVAWANSIAQGGAAFALKLKP
jgi:hypothetical protein